MNEQCRMEFGDGYKACTVFEISDPCSHLWCSHDASPLVCKTKKGPPIEGTECAVGKWCMNGYCEEIGNNTPSLAPVVYNGQDGGWGKWSPWGSCSRTCGIGVQFRSRKCDSPEPSFGGKQCEGSPEEWKVCKLNPCPEPQVDFRAQQCKLLPNILKSLNLSLNALKSWLPHDNNIPELKCKLICVNKETKEVYNTEENLIDGTPCSYESSHICVQGACQPVGCDGELFSQTKEDRCGVCSGDNSTCSIVQSSFRKKVRRELFRLALIPRLARTIKVQANLSSFVKEPKLVFLLKDKKKNSYVLAKSHLGRQSTIFEGTKFKYKRKSILHEISASGPILLETIIIVQVHKTDIDKGINASVISEYYISNAMLNSSTRYKWSVGGYGPCSASCGGGKRQKTIACMDRQDNKIVPRRRCSLIAKPQLDNEKCNTFSCSFYWLSGPWEPCTATCGTLGVQHRELYCVPEAVVTAGNFQNNSGGHLDIIWKYMVSPSKCPNGSPEVTRACNRVPCLSYWTYDWSPCSASCGLGVSLKSFSCPALEGQSSFSCGPLPAQTRRPCQGPFNRFNNEQCRKRKKHSCTEDKSKYCSLASLESYCKLAGFRRICCKTCSTVILSTTTF